MVYTAYIFLVFGTCWFFVYSFVNLSQRLFPRCKFEPNMALVLIGERTKAVGWACGADRWSGPVGASAPDVISDFEKRTSFVRSRKECNFLRIPRYSATPTVPQTAAPRRLPAPQWQHKSRRSKFEQDRGNPLPLFPFNRSLLLPYPPSLRGRKNVYSECSTRIKSVSQQVSRPKPQDILGKAQDKKGALCAEMWIGELRQNLTHRSAKDNYANDPN